MNIVYLCLEKMGRRKKQAKSKRESNSNKSAGGLTVSEVPSTSLQSTNPGLVEEVQSNSEISSENVATGFTPSASTPANSNTTETPGNSTNQIKDTSENSDNKKFSIFDEARSYSLLTPEEKIEQLEPLGINFDKAKYPAYSVYENRLKTYANWPQCLKQNPKEMTEAGFYYTNYLDYVRCFFCGGGLRNWESSDNPWYEHALWFPRCAFLRQNMGNKFVITIQNRYEAKLEGRRPPPFLNPPERDLDTPAAEALRELGYENEIIEKALDQWIKDIHPIKFYRPTLTAVILLDNIFKILDGNIQTPEKSFSISQEDRTEENCNNSLPDTTKEYTEEDKKKELLKDEYVAQKISLECKICREKDSQAAFLPCGHLVCCLDCAPAVRKCLICKKLIKGTIKVYFC